MASEILAIPESKLEFVINVIRTGLEYCDIKNEEEARERLLEWCEDEEEYLNRLKGE